MFADGELLDLVRSAAKGLGLYIGAKGEAPIAVSRGVEVVQSGWERSNYYVELRRWKT
jgi:tRNA (uracil-5-)-methyltransferase TRM9